MSIKIFDTMARKKVDLKVHEDRPILIYVCGVTVYDVCHLGHARSAIAFDIIVRYLRARGIDVKFIKNFTDIDDKIIRKSLEEGIGAKEVANKYIDSYYVDMDAIGITRPDVEPRVTDNMDTIIDMVATLVEKGHAYEVEGDVYFEVSTFPAYGKLSGRNTDEMLSGARVEVDERKRSPLDFVLWKTAKAGEPAWESPWGMGRPGWHIECSAMIEANFGQTIDIHGGGKDLIFPHHENEIAQSEASTGKELARHWIHNGFINVASSDDSCEASTEKMSKSLGNYCTISDVRDQFPAQVLRYLMLTTHYRSPITFSPNILVESEKRLTYLYQTLGRVDRALAGFDQEVAPLADDLKEIYQAMDDDFNTAAVLGILATRFREANELAGAVEAAGGADGGADVTEQLRRLAGFRALVDVVSVFLGILDQEPDQYLGEKQELEANLLSIPEEEIEDLIRQRNEARQSRNWAEADRIRDYLNDKGIVLKDGTEGTTWTLS